MADIHFIGKAADNPDNVLEAAKGDYQDVLVIGWGNSGALDVRASKDFTHKEVLWVIEQFKLKLLRGDYSDEDV